MSIHFIHFSDPSFIAAHLQSKQFKDKIIQTWDGAHFYDDAISNAINHLSNTAAVVAMMMMLMLMWILRNQKM